MKTMTLRLAEAKKPCPACLGEDGYEECIECKGTGIVFVLPEEVRVKCNKTCLEHLRKKGTSFHYQGVNDCFGRGWEPLNSAFLSEWMYAAFWVGYNITMETQPFHSNPHLMWKCSIWNISDDTRKESTGANATEAFFYAMNQVLLVPDQGA